MRIPKTIHYTWFSSAPFPNEVKKCMETWDKFLPDYEFILWDYDKVKNIENKFFQEALKAKKWAFAADFVRIYAVYNEGGIYLDTDVYLYNNFEAFRNDECFIGRENSFHKIKMDYCVFLTAHCFGGVAGNTFLEKCLHYYSDRHFELSPDHHLPEELRYDQKTLPFIQAILAEDFGFDWIYRNNKKSNHNHLSIYPSSYFDAAHISRESVCKHLALGAWREEQYTGDKITFFYKVEWRLIKIMDFFLRKFNYMIVKF